MKSYNFTLNWLQKRAQVNTTDILNLVASGGMLTPAMEETLKQVGGAICGELNAKIGMSGGPAKQRLLAIQESLCPNEETPNMKPVSVQNPIQENSEVNIIPEPTAAPVV